MTTHKFFSLTVCCFLLVLSGVALAQSSGTGSDGPSAPFAHYDIKPSDLPSPNPAEDAVNPPRIVPQPADAKLTLPPGFAVSTFAEGVFMQPRWMALAPNGDVFLADSRAGKIIVLRDKNKDGVAEERFTFVEEMKQPFGMAFWQNYFYVGNTDAVLRFTYKPGQTKAEGTPE